jgi:hypothetical protein
MLDVSPWIREFFCPPSAQQATKNLEWFAWEFFVRHVPYNMFMTITDLINYYLSVPRSTALG